MKIDQNIWNVFSQSFRGDQNALALLKSICDLTNIWDDLIDKDVDEVDAETINRAFWVALVDLPENKFYANYYSRISPILRVGIQNWLAANKFERSGNEKLIDIAHVARYSIGDVVVEMLLIIGGYEWAQHWTPILKPLIAPESRAEYLESIKHVA